MLKQNRTRITPPKRRGLSSLRERWRGHSSLRTGRLAEGHAQDALFPLWGRADWKARATSAARIALPGDAS